MRDPPRTLLLAVILLGHTAAIYLLFLRIERPQQRQQDAEFSALPIRLMPLPESSGSTASSRGGVDQLVIAPPLPMEEPVEGAQPATTQRSTAITMPSPEAEPRAQDPIDWSGQVEARTRGWDDPGSGAMQFGLDANQNEPEEPPPLNIFRSNSPRRAGYVEMLEPGVERRWISSRCYREFGKPSLLIPGTRPDLNPVTCLMGDGPVRDDLFDHLKPDYLQQTD